MPNEARAESEILHTRVRAIVRAFEHQEAMPESFDSLAADVARFQATHIPGYRRLCAARGIEPGAISLAREAPAVPTDAFRLGHVFAFGAADASATFRTSGTTHGARGIHRMRTLDTYDAVALAFGRARLARDLTPPVPVLVIGPSPAEAPDSSLAHMCALFARVLGPPAPPEHTFFVRNGSLDVRGLRGRIRALTHTVPAIVLATSFALVHLLDDLGGDVLALPARSRVMQTGGFKGRAREIAAGDLRLALVRAFGIGNRAIVGEYGMTELSSQFWEATLVDQQAGHGIYVEPPWARVVPVDSQTLAPVPAGEPGIGRIEDLANVDSAFAVLTQDLVRRVPGGFELLGRAAGAPQRGCSIALEEMLSAEAGDERGG
jgi:acyl-protein synthetase LuxE